MPDLNLNWGKIGIDLLWSVLGISMNLTMPIFNRIDVHYKIHKVGIRFDDKIPIKVPFIIPYFAYFPYLVLGWAYIAVFEYDIAVRLFYQWKLLFDCVVYNSYVPDFSPGLMNMAHGHTQLLDGSWFK
jgi:hypothetical protein